jgi:hypothetical protein
LSSPQDLQPLFDAVLDSGTLVVALIKDDPRPSPPSCRIAWLALAQLMRLIAAEGHLLGSISNADFLQKYMIVPL